MARAEAALRKMEEYSISPTPQNYSVWYAYVGGEYPELVRMIDVLLSNKRVFNDELNNQLYDRFFRITTAQANDSLQETGEKLEGEVNRVLSFLNEAAGGADDFDDTIRQNLGALLQGDGLQNVRKVIETLVAESQKARDSNDRLKSRLAESAQEIHELRADLKDMQEVALTDALTGLANRQKFDMALRDMVMAAMEEGDPLCLALLDIDHFKSFNDTYGHQTGDRVLKLVAEMLSSNIKGRDIAARYGGEEMALILPATELADAVTLCEQIRETIASRVLRNKQTGNDLGRITISIGVAEFDPGETLDNLLGRADSCLYGAKEAGRNRTVNEGNMPEDDKAGDALRANA